MWESINRRIVFQASLHMKGDPISKKKKKKSQALVAHGSWLQSKLLERLRLERSWFQASLSKNFSRPPFQKLSVVTCACHPSNGRKHKIVQPAQKATPYLQNN
jgi:hypothetical protein